MVKWWQKLTRGNDYRNDYWCYHEESNDYAWLKHSFAALFIFAILYIANISGTAFGKTIVGGARQILTIDTEPAAVFAQVAGYLPPDFLQSVPKGLTAWLHPADPFQYMTWPVAGKTVVGFGASETVPALTGVNGGQPANGLIITAAVGTPVRAAAGGKVKEVGSNLGKSRVVLSHSQDIETVYQGLENVLVAPQDVISQGQIIGRLAKTGQSDGVLYFELDVQGQPVDPMPRLKEKLP